MVQAYIKLSKGQKIECRNTHLMLGAGRSSLKCPFEGGKLGNGSPAA